MPDETWSEPPERPVLGPAEVHAWRFVLDIPDAPLAPLEATLNPAEIARANRFRGDTLRRRFVAGRGALRSILGRYLGAPPAEVAFDYGPHGKPRLAGAAPTLEFNLTHSHGLALLGLTLQGAFGVDVETERPVDLADRIIERFFSPAEQAEFLTFPPAERPAAFLRGWTRKEAYIKAVGAGLTLALDSFDVTLGRDRPRLLRVGDDPAEAPSWTLADLPAAPDDAAAFALRGPVSAVRLWGWEPPG